MATVLEMERVETAPVGRQSAPGRVDRDRWLLEALRRREPTSTERLIETYGDRAYRLAARITGSAQDAEEVAQDALWTVVRKIDTFRGESAFGSWLYRIVANAAYQKLRGRRGAAGDLSLDDVLPVFDAAGRHAAPLTDWSPLVEDPCRRTELREALTEALDALPADYRAAIVLADVEGLSTAEIAQTLRLTIANVKSRVHRARLFLRKHLAAYAATGHVAAAATTCA
jgi:RNA polymerase sigma-70 factor (ECF subfamily)